MSKKTKNSKPVSLTKSSSEVLADEITKSNAKRGVPLPADISKLSVVKRSKGTKFNPNDTFVITQDGAEFYNAGKLPPQLHFLFDIIIELGVNASVGKVFDIWDERYYHTKKYTQTAVEVYNGHYKGYCEGTTAHKGKRKEFAIQLTGNDTGVCQLLMVS